VRAAPAVRLAIHLPPDRLMVTNENPAMMFLADGSALAFGLRSGGAWHAVVHKLQNPKATMRSGLPHLPAPRR
jgi:hypothetical protein